MLYALHAKKQKQKLNFKIHTKKEPRGEQYKFNSPILIFNKYKYWLLIALNRQMITKEYMDYFFHLILRLLGFL